MRGSSEDDTAMNSEAKGLSSEEDENSSSTQTPSGSLDGTGNVQKYNQRFFSVIVLSLSVLAVVVIVPTFTYRYFRNSQLELFHENFYRCADMVSLSVLDQQQQMRNAILGLANTITSISQSTDAPWPTYSLPLFELMASSVISQSHIESIGIINILNETQLGDWVNYANVSYKSNTVESHRIKYNNLENLPTAGYHQYPTRFKGQRFVTDNESSFFLPAWSISPPIFSYDLLNWNLYTVNDFKPAIEAMLSLKNETVVTKITPYASIFDNVSRENFSNSSAQSLLFSRIAVPKSMFFHPVVANIQNSTIVALLAAVFDWRSMLSHTVPLSVSGLVGEVRNDCNQAFTYLINGTSTTLMGEGLLHDTKYDKLMAFVNVALHTNPDYGLTSGHCQYSLRIYPSQSFEDQYRSKSPTLVTMSVVLSFAFVICAFTVYHHFVRIWGKNLVEKAARTDAIVASIFPDEFRDRIIAPEDSRTIGRIRSSNLGAFVNDVNIKEREGKPIADLFLETTILFADLVGFTAWSSEREPSQVFTLLETLFSRFDEIALRRRVFKVETVGDCYVAASGLPEPRKDHAIVMARFARDILAKIERITRELELTLGPGTGDLSLRIGMHSGPVTAGILRGERSRFQLFGDTMNTTARIESTGEPGKIHVSLETAEILVKAGKKGWLKKRNDKVEAKGKGLITTYWLVTQNPDDSTKLLTASDHGSFIECIEENDVVSSTERSIRLVEWNVEILLKLLKQIIALRNAKYTDDIELPTVLPDDTLLDKKSSFLEEVTEIIALPEFDAAAAERMEDPQHLDISHEVISQLRDYVLGIASMYRKNAFHNFDHASHVMMSVVKLLSRIVAPSEINEAERLHDHTYGITSDPLTQFACVFGALIHDVDHVGVPNAQLIEEGKSVAVKFNNRSVAEQNSLELSWQYLLDDQFTELRRAIMPTPEEYKRFRQLLVNIVMATDIVDKDLKALRNARWDKAFHAGSSETNCETSVRDQINRKATIVIEHLIQASDVSHTMQHWHIYRKWNEKFFAECYKAYLCGRAKRDPVEYWYEGEIGFFDFYIIPLTKKLQECGVFGKSSSEYLDYAMRNRSEWEAKGKEVVAEMMESIRSGINQEDLATSMHE